MGTVTLTAEDFANVPWDGMAVHKDGDRAVRIPEGQWDKLCWSIGNLERWRSDEFMAKEGGWTILPTVTTAREALDAAWELAYEPEDGVVPEGSQHLARPHGGGFPASVLAGTDMKAVNASCERRLLDPPEPKPEPEPWETSPYVICDDLGNTLVAERWGSPDGPVWYAPRNADPLTRDEIAAMNPKPFDPSEVA